ncbi:MULTISPECIES: DUF2141 domain-containing protein [unclassified Nostoc]|jgi:uncharacterized protein (DUF2141 family)|uniref:DUF2141 domain-containing protein n=1 Tax=unclassified Nostoc TaxID=2593658 RepID=UPI000DEC9D98|nr:MULTISPECIES: DUF2141 domain-containing protein [unclassified Nostoc]MBD2510305.1 DUF2141 domain-containing protein [Desmonostoc muscorum FACHB-395]QHG17210.1 DUF2141 domain-containing protein [Nostoc sp. ATCC 53789]QLE49967.1 DUF2141 domain-containing protein [Nostoc sp. C057]RCJ17349.1 hypothetical protein A6V25_29600 [Nostoc sp. ATCC 53789]
MVRELRVGMLLLAIVGNMAWSLSAKANFNGKLTLEIDGLKNKEGQVCTSIFASSEGFPSDRDRGLQKQCTKITDTPLSITFENLKAGNYAVAVFHDQNNDRILNSNVFGIPKEGFGFSRNPEIRTGAPKFGEAAFLVAGPNTNIQIQLKYF